MRNNRLLKYLTVMILVVAMLSGFAAIASAIADVTAPVVTSVVPADGSTIYRDSAGTTFYQDGNATPMQIRATYADEAGGSGIDVTSVMVHLDVANMLFDCPTQTETSVACNATAADLLPGNHPVDIYVGDLAGNMTMNRTYVNVVVDSEAPTYSNLTPAGGTTIYTSQLNSTGINDMSALRFDYDIADAAPSSGWSPMSHINDTVPPGQGGMGAMISNTSCVKTPAINPTHYSCQVNRASKLRLGDNTLSVLLKDKVGNKSSDYSDPSTLKHYTVVDDVAPAVSGVSGDATTITASYSDPLPAGALSTNLASGMDTASAMVHVDGAMIMMGCTATTTGVSCPTPAGLAPGPHTIEVMVSDTAGNSGSGTGSLCIGCRPTLTLRNGGAYWASYGEYEQRLLSVTWRVTNGGGGAGKGVQLTSSAPGGGATLATPMPAAIGDIAPGSNGSVVVKYSVPAGVNGFRVTNTASAQDECGNLYVYP